MYIYIHIYIYEFYIYIHIYKVAFTDCANPSLFIPVQSCFTVSVFTVIAKGPAEVLVDN